VAPSIHSSGDSYSSDQLVPQGPARGGLPGTRSRLMVSAQLALHPCTGRLVGQVLEDARAPAVGWRLVAHRDARIESRRGVESRRAKARAGCVAGRGPRPFAWRMQDEERGALPRKRRRSGGSAGRRRGGPSRSRPAPARVQAPGPAGSLGRGRPAPARGPEPQDPPGNLSRGGPAPWPRLRSGGPGPGARARYRRGGR
jgi:hypothetical protein